MKTFLPHTITIGIITSCLLIIVIGFGFLITRIRNYRLSILLAWLLLIISTVIVEWLCADEAAGYRMMCLIFVMFFSLKVIVTVEVYRKDKAKLSLQKWLAFTIGWIGMRPKLFETLGEKALPGGRQLMVFGITRIALGVACIFLAKWMMHMYKDFYFFTTIATVVLLIGLSLILHFGILNINAGIWRKLGVDTRMLFRTPLLSTSLTEFWGKRWNLAFSEMTAIAIFRPLKNKLGITVATFIAFLFSGLVHEIAISVPVLAGFGLPFLYFIIHGVVMMLEKLIAKKGYNISTVKWLGRSWVLFWLIVPLPLLFHSAFVREIIQPLVGLK